MDEFALAARDLDYQLSDLAHRKLLRVTDVHGPTLEALHQEPDAFYQVVHVLHDPGLRAVAVDGEGRPARAWEIMLGIMRPSPARRTWPRRLLP